MSAIDRRLTGDIVSLRLERARRGDATLRKIEEYWQGLRKGRLVPTRGELDPRGLDGVLGHAFIVERIAPGVGRFRIAGAHLTEMLGLDVRGMPMSVLFEPASRNEMSELLAEAFDGPSLIRMSVSSPESFGKPPLKGRMVLMPLRSDTGDITRILGAVRLDGAVGRTARQLRLDDVAVEGLTGRGEVVEAAGGRASPAPVFRRRVIEEPRPALSLVVNNDL